ncbi:MAG: NAD/NADP octopine/nopaline dehydrogenase family protein [Solirubrobacteraceae bacterium]
MEVAVLGGGNGSHAAAADLTDRNHAVSFWRRDTEALQALAAAGSELALRDAAGTRSVRLARVCAGVGEAVRGAAVIVAPLPAFAQAELARALAPHLVDDQVIFIPPGSFGSRVMARELARADCRARVTFVEAGTLPYLARMHGERTVTITGRAVRLPCGALPGERSAHALDLVRDLYPAIVPVADALDAALLNAGPIIHPPLILMNAAALDRSQGFDIHSEGTQRSTRAVQDALDAERIAVRSALGYTAPHFPLADHYDPEREWMYGKRAHETLVASDGWREPVDLRGHRYMREDVACGLVLLVSLGRGLGVACPVAEGLVAIASAVLGEDLFADGRTLGSLGLDGLDAAQLRVAVQSAATAAPRATAAPQMSATANRAAPIGIVGPGRMGVGLAIACAYAGEHVALVDLKRRPEGERAALAGTVTEIEAGVATLVAAGVVSELQAAAIVERIALHPLSGASALGGAEVVFEAVPELLDAKREALALIEQHAPGAIVASTTSSFGSDELAELVSAPDRLLCTHWLNPAYLIPLVEVSPALKTDQGAIDAVLALLRRLGKVPVVCRSSPGYIVPRIQALAMNEAARLAEEGVASVEAIDTATRVGFGVRFAILGLLEFIDWGGAEILHRAAEHLADAFDDQRFAPPPIVREHIRSGATGMRAGRGFIDFKEVDLAGYQRETIARLAGLLSYLGLLRAPAEACAKTESV